MALHEESPSGLEVLRSRIAAAHVPRARAENLRLATWNVRELGKGTRLDESIRLIATIIDAFDLVSIVELRDDLGDMRRILRVLGSRWSIVFSDYLRDAGGNRERVAFVFDKTRVTFTGLASTAEGPRRRAGDHYVPTIPWWRPPFMASFRAGDFDFLLLAAHVRWGPSAAARRQELADVAAWIVARSKDRRWDDRSAESSNHASAASAAATGDSVGLRCAVDALARHLLADPGPGPTGVEAHRGPAGVAIGPGLAQEEPGDHTTVSVRRALATHLHRHRHRVRNRERARHDHQSTENFLHRFHARCTDG